MKKKNYSEKEIELLQTAIKYKFSYEEMLSKLPFWKQDVINSNTGQLNDDRVVVEFVKSVVENAESMN